MVKKKKICYHHTDPDGLASAAIVRKATGCEEFQRVQYNRPFDISLADSKDVYLVDFSFQRPDMDELMAKDLNSFTWIDHHESALDNLTDLWYDETIPGIRSTDKAACELVWDHFYPKKKTPHAIELIGDRDLWKGKYGEESQLFGESFYIMVETADDKIWNKLLSDDKKTLDDFIMQGKVLAKARDKRVKIKYYIGFDVDFHGHKARFINSGGDVSAIGQYVLDKGYDLCVCYSDRKDRTQFDLRGRGVDVKEIAMKYGGGGHLEAAGFRIQRDNLPDELLKIIENGKTK